ncbi:hypothetical protein [Candidatus Methanocrinis natronophilus]|uniref:CRISPR-associated protein Csx11 n=1 Tax=Candidatus Methanocrinis natronophilus TaxID=3033396 RepID=A0ABT5X8G1_9EURY|nr:hypothetical protein [Candidatus Methanocrinis natronophilus]MDF0590976.1 hypothetical protein [Candidatus Methanocrinis natronophilus]
MIDLSKLEECRDSMILAATGAMLHNLGKVSSKFIEPKLTKEGTNFLYQHILNLIDPLCPKLPEKLWDKCPNLPQSDILNAATKQMLSSNSFNLPCPYNDRVYVPGDLIEYLGQREPWYADYRGKLGIFYLFENGSLLTHLMNRAHRGASGGEKEDMYKEDQTDGRNLWIATPFGWERPALSLPDIDDLRIQVETAIQKHLGNNPSSSSLEQLSIDLQMHLSKTIADTRRPVNDVTVWDIGHTGMAFLVTEAIGHILAGRPLEHNDFCRTESQNMLFWRVLSIRTCGLRYLEEANTLADLRVRKRLLEQALERVRSALERNLLAIQVYKDENGSYYIFPEFECDVESILKVVNSIVSPLVEIDCRILEVKLSSDIVVNHPKDKGGKNIGDYILDDLIKNPSDKSDPALINPAWKEPYINDEICSECGIRPQGYGPDKVSSYRNNPEDFSEKARRRKLCCLCMHRRSGVAEQWVSRIRKGVDSCTVWTDEVADKNGRIALVAGNLPAEQFIRFMAYPHEDHSWNKFKHHVQWVGSPPPVDTTIQIKGQGQFKWTGTVLIGEDELRTFKDPNLNIHYPHSMNLVSDQIESDNGGNIFIEVSNNLIDEFGINGAIKIWGKDFTVVDNHRLKTTNSDSVLKVRNMLLWSDNSANFFFWVRNAKPVFLTESEAATNNSFARIRRVWETTHNFWKEVCPSDVEAEMAQSLVRHQLRQKEHRFMIKPKDVEELELGSFNAYDLVLPKGVRMSVVWDSIKNIFITSDNLDYLVTKQQLDEPLQSALQRGVNLTIEEPVGYGAKTKIRGAFEIAEVAKIPKSAYTPVIPILAEPRNFMALVPADRALEVIEAIKAKYEREMGKVLNRLPLHLGVVYARRRTPLRAILNAGRRMLDQSATPEGWKVVKADPKSIENGDKLPKRFNDDESGQFNEWYEIFLENDGRQLKWYVPAVMGDGKTPDLWYPYVFLNTLSEPSYRDRSFQALNPWTGSDGWLVHVADLKTDDSVYFTPATLDFQWLDSAGRRFEIAYDNQGQRRGLHRRPYLLDELEDLERIWKTLKNHLSKNQIYAIRDLIEAKRAEWQEMNPVLAEFNPQGEIIKPPEDVFWQFCYNALANAEWRDGEKPWQVGKRDRDIWLAQWANYLASGWFTDVVELHLQIMKEEVQI